MVESLKIITSEKSTKIAKYAFDFAKRHGRKKVTAIHKANIMYVVADIHKADNYITFLVTHKLV